VAHIEADADGAVAFRQKMVDGRDAGLLHEQDHLRRGKHLDAAAAQVLGGVLLSDDQAELSGKAWFQAVKGHP